MDMSLVFTAATQADVEKLAEIMTAVGKDFFNTEGPKVIKATPKKKAAATAAAKAQPVEPTLEPQIVGGVESVAPTTDFMKVVTTWVSGGTGDERANKVKELLTAYGAPMLSKVPEDSKETFLKDLGVC